MPLISDVLNQLGDAQWFSSLDLQSVFWQIKMHEPDIKKTVIITKRGLYEWTVMPFGLKNATATFHRINNQVLEEDLNGMYKVFVDDVNIHSKEWLEYLQHIDRVLKKLHDAQLCLNPNKYRFGFIELVFLNHSVSGHDCFWVTSYPVMVAPSPAKVEAIM